MAGRLLPMIGIISIDGEEEDDLAKPIYTYGTQEIQKTKEETVE